MPKVLIAPREVAKFADRFRAPLNAAGLEVVALPPAEANLPAESERIAALQGVEAVIAGSEPAPFTDQARAPDDAERE